MAQTSYSATLSPWAIYRQTGVVNHVCLGRFRNRSDAEGYLKVLKDIEPDGQFEIVFDVPHQK